MKYLVIFFLVLITFSAGSANGLPHGSEFQASLTRALKDQDREAFYKLVCFDGCDKDWVKTNKQRFEDLFKEAASSPKFTGSIGGWGGKIVQPLPTQTYNIPLAAAYLLHVTPGATMNVALGMKDGELRVACLVLKVEVTK